MKLYKLFNDEEREIIKPIEIIEENKDYTKEEISRMEHRILEDIMSNSKKDISQERLKYSGILDKLESYSR